MGGIVTAPSSGVWDPIESQWIAENVGISPDVEVEHDPELVRKGADPQLERAVQEIMTELAKNPPKPLVRPKFPKYSTLKKRDWNTDSHFANPSGCNFV